MRQFLSFIIFVCVASLAHAQEPAAYVARTLPNARVEQKVLYHFDLSRPVVQFDATPDGSLWYAVEMFGTEYSITINGVHRFESFGDISPFSTKISPNGKYMIWAGIAHVHDQHSINTSLTTLFRQSAESDHSDSLFSVQSDHAQVYFSANGNHWAALLPASNTAQKTPRDVAVVDGKEVSEGYPNPKMFTFNSDCSNWAYRSRNDTDENLITAAGKQLLFHRTGGDSFVLKSMPMILRYSPDVRLHEYQLDGRDFDFGLRNVATTYQTSYMKSGRDSARQYVVFNGKRQLYSKWISNIQIGPGGNHIVYFAADTTTGVPGNQAVLVRDGKIIAGPYENTLRLFLSPSGEHTAWTVGDNAKAQLFLDGKLIAIVGDYMSWKWSPNEKQFAYVTSDQNQKMYVVAGGRRSETYDFIGQLAISADGKTVEYIGAKYDKVLRNKQRF